MRRLVATLLLATLLATPAHAQDAGIHVKTGVDWLFDAVVQDDAAWANFSTPFNVSGTGVGLLKPTQFGNAAHDNGTVDQDGWWTEVWLEDNGTRVLKGKTAHNNDVVDVGALSPDTNYTLILRVHIPGEALNVSDVQHRLHFTFCLELDGSSGQGGGSCPSKAILPRVRVLAPPEDPSAPEEPDGIPGDEKAGGDGGGGGGGDDTNDDPPGERSPLDGAIDAVQSAEPATVIGGTALLAALLWFIIFAPLHRRRKKQAASRKEAYLKRNGPTGRPRNPGRGKP